MLIHDRELHALSSQRAHELRRALRAERLASRGQRPPRHAVRRAVGESMVRIGRRLAAEPELQPARSR